MHSYQNSSSDIKLMNCFVCSNLWDCYKCIILENCYNNDVSLKDAGKTLAGIRLISACFIIVQKENKGRN